MKAITKRPFLGPSSSAHTSAGSSVPRVVVFENLWLEGRSRRLVLLRGAKITTAKDFLRK
jgi:hypothetical protein